MSGLEYFDGGKTILPDGSIADGLAYPGRVGVFIVIGVRNKHWDRSQTPDYNGPCRICGRAIKACFKNKPAADAVREKGHVFPVCEQCFTAKDTTALYAAVLRALETLP